MNKICGIYFIKNKIDGKVYIGSSINIKNRWIRHKYQLKKYEHNNIYLQNAWNKYKEENFEFIIIASVLDKSKLIKWEQYFLDLYKPFGENGYNILLNAKSFLGMSHSKESKNKMSIARKGKKLSNETKNKISQSMIGKKNHFYGEKHSEEFKKYLSENRIGKNNPFYGKKWSKENTEKMRVKNTGILNPRYGQEVSKNTRKKMSIIHKGKRPCEKAIENHKRKYKLEPFICEQNNKIYTYTGDAARELKLYSSIIRQCLYGKRKTHGGYTFRFLKEVGYNANII